MNTAIAKLLKFCLSVNSASRLHQLEEGETPSGDLGFYSVNRMIRYQASLTFIKSAALRMEVDAVCKVHQRVLRDTLRNHFNVDPEPLLLMIEKFIAIISDMKRANSELVPLFEQYVHNYAEYLFDAPVFLESLSSFTLKPPD